MNKVDSEYYLPDSEEEYLSENEEYEYGIDKMAQFEKDYPLEDSDIDSEEERYYRDVIFKKTISYNTDIALSNDSPQKSPQISPQKEKKSMSLNDLNIMIDKIEEDKKPKRFISKRSEEKKKQMNL